MIKKILEKVFKKVIEIHVDIAVEKVEQLFGNGKGEEKKAMAVSYVMQFIKLPSWLSFLMPFVQGALISIVDKAVELAVNKLHALQNTLLAG